MRGDCMAKEVIVKAGQIKHRKLLARVMRISMLSVMSALSIMYLVLGLVYKEGRFTVEIGSQDGSQSNSGLAIFTDLNSAQASRKLVADPIKNMDNIDSSWISPNVDTEKDGSHNGDNYIAFSFYVENQGENPFHYWYEVLVDDMVKNVDDAVRVRIYHNGKETTYAKMAANGSPEPGTTPFVFDESRSIIGQSIISERRDDMQPGDLDRITIVIWLHGPDNECVDNIIGGAIKMHMKISEQPIG